MFKAIVMIGAVVSVLAMPVGASEFLADRHAARGVDCATCHGVKTPTKAADTAQCLACHGDYAKLKALTQDVTPNPHYTHMLDQPCIECHQGHKPSVNMCNDCHKFDLKVP